MCVVENGKVLFNQAYGVTDTKSTRRWEKNSPVQIASMTKSITSTLVAVLVGEGKLAFDDPISKYIPEYGHLKMRKSGAEVRSPTIAECLSHTSGFPGGTMGRLPASSPIRTSNQAGVATSLAKQGMAAKPGTKFAYTFRGFAAVARCVEVVTGKRFPEILEEKLLKPLGMSSTTFQPDLELLKRHPRYAKHIANLDDEKISAFLEKKKRESKRFVNAGGGLISSPFEGIIKELKVSSGNTVKAGDLVLIMEVAERYKPTENAEALVDYLLSLKSANYPLPEAPINQPYTSSMPKPAPAPAEAAAATKADEAGK